MSSVNFEEFENLWRRVEDKFTTDEGVALTLDNLRDLLINRNLVTPLTNLQAIEAKFLRHRTSTEKPPSVNLSDTIYTALFKYLGIRGIAELRGGEYVSSDEVLKKVAEEAARPRSVPTEIDFLGREKELLELDSFLESGDARIFALYGVPMIGKTKLVNRFLQTREIVKKYSLVTVKLNPAPENAEDRIKKAIFGEKDYSDLSSLPVKTLVVIENFEEALNWTGSVRELHDINNDYPQIKELLRKTSQDESVKLILESRFQIHFEVFLEGWRSKVRTLPNIQLDGVARDEFWSFYKSRGFSREQFDRLADNFDNHTGLLALAFNDVDWLFQNRLIEAYYQPKLVTRFLWDLVERIIDRLENRELWVLCALTFLQEPVKKEDLYESFLEISEFTDEVEIGDAFASLSNKLLIQVSSGRYDLNPYIREVCYDFLTGRKRDQIATIQNLSYFKEHGRTPFYNEIRRARDRGDFLFLLRRGQDLRKEHRYDEAIKTLKAGLDINPKEEVVLNELGISYREDGQFAKAIEVLEKAVSLDNIHSYTELGISYRENGQLDKAIEVLEDANRKQADNVRIINELGISYRENGQLDKAIPVLEGANLKHPDDVRIINELGISYRTNRQYEKAIEVLENARRRDPDNATILNELGISYRENGQLDKAIPVLEGANLKHPDDVRIINELGISYRTNRQYDKAIEVLEDAHRKNPNDVLIINELGISYRENNELGRAIDVVQRGVALTSGKNLILINHLKELGRVKEREKSPKTLSVFLSYSHKDNDIKVELDKALSALKRSEKISTWNDRRLPAGAEWDEVIKTELENADIVLLLVSADFIASNYIWDVEIRRAIERHHNGTAMVIPIFCRACDFDGMPFAKLQGLPNDARFIKSQPNPDEAYTEVAKGIRELVDRLLS